MSHFDFTGNPFVDTGLSVIVAHAKRNGWDGSEVWQLTPEAIRLAVGDGKWLALANRRLKAFSMVSGTNSPLTNPSSNPSLGKRNSGKFHPYDDDGFQEYLVILAGLISELVTESTGILCECCGTLSAAQTLKVRDKEVGRDWFPLAGSFSDAQALPASSRPPRICALCLLAVQFLPLGVSLLSGKLACFQSTSWRMTQVLTEYHYRETRARFDSTSDSDKVSALGTKEPTTNTSHRLLQVFRNLRESQEILELPPHVALNIWLFSNAGAGADCDLIEVPNRGLVFLWEAAQRFHTEVERLLQKEQKLRSESQLLECVRRQRDYEPLYPSKGQPASKELFAYYQTQVMERPANALQVAEKIAGLLRKRLRGETAAFEQLGFLPAADVTDRKSRKREKEETSPDRKLLKSFEEKHPREWEKWETHKAKGLLAEIGEDGFLTLEEYVSLFPAVSRQPLRVGYEGWKWIWFYLNCEDLSTETSPPSWEEVSMFTNPKIKQFAHDVFEDYRERRGLERVKRDILERFKRPGEITNATLQRWFCNLAETKGGYSNEEWDDLCRDEKGNNMTYEVRFQFRLELANLYRQASQ